MASVSLFTFFSCCWTMGWSRSCSAYQSRVFSKSVLKFWSGLRCGLGRYWEETFADVFFQDTERFPSFGVSSLQVGDSVLL